MDRGGFGTPDEHADNVPGVPDGRLHAAEVVASKLGELLEDLLDEVRCLPRWRPAPIRRREMERSIAVGLTFFHAWRDAFGDGGVGSW